MNMRILFAFLFLIFNQLLHPGENWAQPILAKILYANASYNNYSRENLGNTLLHRLADPALRKEDQLTKDGFVRWLYKQGTSEDRAAACLAAVAISKTKRSSDLSKKNNNRKSPLDVAQAHQQEFPETYAVFKAGSLMADNPDYPELPSYQEIKKVIDQYLTLEDELSAIPDDCRCM